MPHEMKKRTVRDRLRQKYIRVVRARGSRDRQEVSFRLSEVDFPTAAQLTFAEIGLLLDEIVNEQRGSVTVGPINGGSTRVRRNFYPVRVTSDAFPQELLSSVSPVITENGRSWGMILPGETRFIPIGKKESLKGELFAVLGQRLGREQSVEYILGELERRVHRKRRMLPDVPAVLNALREINETMHTAIGRRLQRIGTLPHTIGAVMYKHMLWSAISRMVRGQLRVGIIRG